MRTLSFVASLVVLSLPSFVSAQVAQEWVASYDNPNASLYSWTMEECIATDSDGNVYIAGGVWDPLSGAEIVTAKHNADGAIQWTKRYSGPRKGEYCFAAIVIDVADNVYVTGISSDNYNLVAIKYDPDGNELWVDTRDVEICPYSPRPHIAVDGECNVAITGCKTVNEESDFFTVKYDANGNILWTNTYSSPGNDLDSPKAVTFDSEGNAFVVGHSDRSEQQLREELTIIKYNPTGEELWVVNHAQGTRNFAHDIAVDDSGHIIVVGSFDSSMRGREYLTIKYDTDGVQQWISIYGGSNSDSAVLVEVDRFGNVYVAGTSEDPDNVRDIVTVKYDSEGNELWVARSTGNCDGSAIPNAIALDRESNVYIAGTTRGVEPDYYDYITIKYNSSGIEQWARIFGELHDGIEIAYGEGLVTDAYGSVIVTGTTGPIRVDALTSEADGPGITYSYPTTIKYTQSGDREWISKLLIPGSNNDYSGSAVKERGKNSVAVDSQGYIYITGASPGLGTGLDVLTAKYDPHGSLVWEARYNGEADSTDHGYSIVVNEDGSVYVAGTSVGIGTRSDIVVLKYGRTGEFLWDYRFNGPRDDVDYPFDMARDHDGNIVVTGGVDGSYEKATGDETWGEFTDMVTIKVDSFGALQWIVRYDGGSSSWDVGRAVDVDANGNIYVAGGEFITIKYDEDGNELWIRQFDAEVYDWREASELAFDEGGNVYIAGKTSIGRENNLTIVKYDTDGSMLWYKFHEDSLSTNSMVVDGAGNVYVAGWFGGHLYEDVIMKCNTEGVEEWVVNGPLYEALVMTLDEAGNVYVTGRTDDKIATAKYDSDGNVLWSAPFSRPGDGDGTAIGITTDTFGGTYVFGWSDNPETGDDFVIIKYDESVPVAMEDVYSTDEDVRLLVWDVGGVLANDSDANPNQTLTVTEFDMSSANGGTVSVNPDGSFVYVPPLNFSGSDGFAYTVSDPAGLSAAGAVSIAVEPVNDAPEFVEPTPEGMIQAITDVELVFNMVAEDAEGDQILYSVVGLPPGATVGSSTGRFSWIPGSSDEGDWEIGLVASDNEADGVRLVTIRVSAPEADDVGIGCGCYTTTTRPSFLCSLFLCISLLLVFYRRESGE